MKHKIFSTIASLTLCLGLLPQSVLAGNAGGNGGDYVKALVEAGLYEQVVKIDNYSEETKSEVRADFIRSGLAGIWAIMILLESDYEFKRKDRSIVDLTMDDIVEALSMLKKLSLAPEKIELKNSLILNGETVTALNFEDGHIELNIPRWKEIEYLYKEEFSDRIKGMVAAHEILSLIPRKIETTGIYDVSSRLAYFQNAFLSKYQDLPGNMTSIYPRFYNGSIKYKASLQRFNFIKQDVVGTQYDFNGGKKALGPWLPLSTAFDWDRDYVQDVAIFWHIQRQVLRNKILKEKSSAEVLKLRTFRYQRLAFDGELKKPIINNNLIDWLKWKFDRNSDLTISERENLIANYDAIMDRPTPTLLGVDKFELGKCRDYMEDFSNGIFDAID